MHFDHEYWKQWEGQRIDAKYSLDRLTHSDGARAGYETTFRERAAIIQFFAGSPEEIAARRQRWRESAGLSNPALVEIFERGETALGESHCAYIITERPDDNLSEVLRDRTLTTGEAREMLAPLLGVVRYLHERGFTHGELRPENIMAFGDQLKVSSDSLTPGGDTASDCAAIGALVNQVLGSELAAPFSEIAKQSNVVAMEACLRGESVAERGSRWKWWAGGATALLAAIAFWPSTPPPAPAPAAAEPTPIVAPPAAPVSMPPPAPSPVVKPSPTSAPIAKASEPAPPKPPPAQTEPVRNLDGISQVLPEIPQQARNTITGRVRMNIRVSVDGNGQVTQATLESPGVSPYFSSRVLVASRAWKFPAGQPPSEWLLRYELMRVDTKVSVSKAR